MPKFCNFNNLSNRDYEAIVWAFSQIGGAPLPKNANEYHGGSPSLNVFFSKFGFVARISNQSDKNSNIDIHPLFRHKHLLRPLGSIKAGNYRIDLQPAWIEETTIEDAVKIHAIIRKWGIHYTDELEHNCLYIPRSDSTRFPHGYPVCFDPWFLTSISDRVHSIQRMLHPKVYDLSPHKQQRTDKQDQIYGHLRQKFAEACDHRLLDLIPEKIDAFLLACRHEVKDTDGVLYPGWIEEETPAGIKANEKAEAYEKRLLKIPRLQRLML